MKQKIDTLIDDDIVQLARRRAAKEKRSLSHLIQDALVQYLRKDPVSPTERARAYRLFCEQPIKIPSDQLRYVLEEDVN
jgi:hypothetical protein